MQPRTLESIIAELDNAGGYGAQTQSLRNQQALIPGQIADEEKGLQAKQDTAFGDIVNGSRQRGVGFSGIPLAEQAKYTSTEFLPALARLRTQGKQQAMSLEDAILGIQERRTNAALGIRQNEQSLAEQQRQFNESLAQQRAQAAASQRAANSFQPSVGGNGGGQPAQNQPVGTFQKKANGGFSFADQSGRAISAAKYAQLNNQDIRDVIYQMGQAGDAYSQQLYNQLAADQMFGKGNTEYDKRIYQAYSPIFWGIS